MSYRSKNRAFLRAGVTAFGAAGCIAICLGYSLWILAGVVVAMTGMEAFNAGLERNQPGEDTP